MKLNGDETILTRTKLHSRPNDSTTTSLPDLSDDEGCRELQGTPRNQQCTSAATEKGRTVGSDDPREGYDLLKDYTQRISSMGLALEKANSSSEPNRPQQ